MGASIFLFEFKLQTTTVVQPQTFSTFVSRSRWLTYSKITTILNNGLRNTQTILILKSHGREKCPPPPTTFDFLTSVRNIIILYIYPSEPANTLILSIYIPPSNYIPPCKYHLNDFFGMCYVPNSSVSFRYILLY